jgi:hypothetical protein
MNEQFEQCPPVPEALINSLRAFGYDLSMAISDLIDNSIYAGARSIEIDYDWNGGDPWILIIDEGMGMSEETLRNAMRLGSKSPLADRDPSDLGRFGLGLKTASFSQCKILSVKSKTDSGISATRVWDLDHVRESGNWEIKTKANMAGERILAKLDRLKSGTAVLWQNLDRVIGQKSSDDEENRNQYLEKFNPVAKYLEAVYHRFLSDRPGIQISVGHHRCKPWDPFLTTNKFSRPLLQEQLHGGTVRVAPFVLPHISNRSRKENEEGAGILGWNAHQGFYVYRNKRMIIQGGYLDFDITPEEHFKLGRIRVDLPNTLDHEWNIDVRKAAASPPASVRKDLRRIAKATRKEAVQIYRARSGGQSKEGAQPSIHPVWLKQKRANKIVYKINKNNEAISAILQEVGTDDGWARKLFHLIESTVPFRQIIIDNSDHEDCQVDLPVDLAPPPRGLLEVCKTIFLNKVKSGMDPHDAASFTCAFFDSHPAYRAMIDSLIMEGF